MVTHWESSNRPLFVKTIWKNGQHHVVLKQDIREKHGAHQQVRSSRPSAVAHNSKNSARSLLTATSRSNRNLTTSNATNFKVPSVKLLLAAFKSSPREDETIQSCSCEKAHREEKQSANYLKQEMLKTALTIDIVPSVPVGFNNINKQVSFQETLPISDFSAIKTKRQKFVTLRSNSMDVSRTTFSTENNNNHEKCPLSPIGENRSADELRASFTERVMIWLDLAIQNHKEFKNVDLKKRMAKTAQPIVRRKQCLNKTRKSHPLINANKYKYDIATIIDKSETDSNNNSQEKNENATKIINRKNSVEKVVSNKVPIITSHLECETIENINGMKRVKLRADTAKRQLHIFLPNLPKKSIESDSLLSSKNSSLVPIT